jgi:DNA topoisomerase-1
MRSLVIVESPAKARTINKILGKEFDVAASVGHIKDLPKKTLGVEVQSDFKAEYTVIPGKEKIIRELKRAAKAADRIYLAPDPDREGEAIAYHIATEIAGGKPAEGRIFRVAFNEITPRAVREAMEKPGKIDIEKVEAQQARRILDRLVGYNLSPLLWKKIRGGLSAGRVQSVAVRLMVDREREIMDFKKQEHWSITAGLEGASPPEFQARLFEYNGKPLVDKDEKKEKRFLITEQESAHSVSEELKQGAYTLRGIEKKTRKKSPSPPFITSTLQQEASRKLGFSAKKTMLMAQQLYEGTELGAEGSHGLITYMRTDSVRIAPEAQAWAREYILSGFGKEYLPAKPPRYKSRAAAQEAHEAIRPTGLEYPPAKVKAYLGRDQNRLYSLIWNRFIASQMKPASMEQTTFDISCFSGPNSAALRATGTVVKFHGFMALYTESIEELVEEEGGLLPDLKEGGTLHLKGIEPKQHFTQPPPRYSEASLVKTLEEKGIGRPSTYATILSTVTGREYVSREQGRFIPTDLGFVVNDYLVERFPELMDVGFTARMEDDLDGIEAGKFKWLKIIGDFYTPFDSSLKRAEQAVGKARPEDISTEEVCEKCSSPMVKRWGRHGWFMACSAFPECKNTRPIQETPAASVEEATEEKCPKCGSPMVIKTGRFGRFMACTKYPDCKSTKPIPTGVKCPVDGGDIIQRRSKKGKPFWSCGNYPECKFATWQKPLPEKCPDCDAKFLVIRKDRAGNALKSCLDKECGFKEALKEA